MVERVVGRPNVFCTNCGLEMIVDCAACPRCGQGAARTGVSPKKMGFILLQGLLHLVDSNKARDNETINALLKENVPQQKAGIYEEIQYLRIYGIDFGAFTVWSATPLYDAVIDSFYSFLRKAETDGIVPPGTLQEYRTRQVAYMAALRAATSASKKNTLFVGIGGTFA